MVHAPHIAKVVEQLIFLAVDDGLELSLSLLVLLLIEIYLAEESLGSAFRDASEILAAISAAHGQIWNSLKQIFLDLCIGLFFAGALYAGHLRRHLQVEHQWHAAEVLYQIEVLKGAQKLCLGDIALLERLVVELHTRDAFDGDVALENAFVAILPEVLTAVSGADGVTRVVSQVKIIARILSRVTHPFVVGAHITCNVELVYLPPVVVGHTLIAARHLLGTFILRREIVFHVLLTTDRLFEEIGAATDSKRQCSRHGQTQNILFHSC